MFTTVHMFAPSWMEVHNSFQISTSSFVLRSYSCLRKIGISSKCRTPPLFRSLFGRWLLTLLTIHVCCLGGPEPGSVPSTRQQFLKTSEILLLNSTYTLESSPLTAYLVFSRIRKPKTIHQQTEKSQITLVHPMTQNEKSQGHTRDT